VWAYGRSSEFGSGRYEISRIGHPLEVKNGSSSLLVDADTPTRRYADTPTRFRYVPLWRVTMATPIFAKIRIPPNAPPSQVTITRKAFSAL
jgi:hypothetical protein